MDDNLKKHIMSLCAGNERTWREYSDKYWITTPYRFIHFDEDIIDIKLNRMTEAMETKIKNQLREDYVLYKLPAISEIKKQISELVGRKKDMVIWSDGTITVNARYLVSAMTAMKAKSCYVVDKKNPGFETIFIFYKDDVTSPVYEGIMPIRNVEGRAGVWRAI